MLVAYQPAKHKHTLHKRIGRGENMQNAAYDAIYRKFQRWNDDTRCAHTNYEHNFAEWLPPLDFGFCFIFQLTRLTASDACLCVCMCVCVQGASQGASDRQCTYFVWLFLFWCSLGAHGHTQNHHFGISRPSPPPKKKKSLSTSIRREAHSVHSHEN